VRDAPLERLVDDPCGHPVGTPQETGTDADLLAALVARATRTVVEGRLPTCQLAVARHGRLVVCRTIGAEPTSRYLTYSCTKALIAGAYWQLLGTGALTRATRVAEVIPEFGAHGKDAVTVEHLLTHTAGFPDANFSFREWADPVRRRARFAAWTLAWEPGTRCVYHPASAHWVLADVLEAVTGRDFREHVRHALLDPLGLPALQLGTPESDQGDVLDVQMVGTPPEAGAEVSAETDLLAHNDPALRAVGQPGGGAIGRAGDLAMYYQALLANPGGLWDPDVLRAGTTEIACALVDPMLGVAANRTLGLVCAGDDGHASLRGFGGATSAQAFGHMGAGGQIAWADPATGISFAFCTNGLERDPWRAGARGHGLSTRAGGVALGA
jgi:CubicO group peptidase (beta-lactamase class C family)